MALRTGGRQLWRIVVPCNAADGSRSFAAKAKAAPSKAKKKPSKAGKKGKEDPDAVEDKGTSERVRALIDMCLEAPAPVRHLKEKARLREQQLESVGIITKDRQKELDAEKDRARKAAREEKKKKEKGEGDQKETEEDEFEFTAEEGKRLAKEASRILMREERLQQKRETWIIKLKYEAIAALPPHLKAAAMEPDMAPFPKNRVPATLSPPIEGFQEESERISRILAGLGGSQAN